MTTEIFKSIADLKMIIPNIVWSVTPEIDLCYSEDDDNNKDQGWYFQKGHHFSQSFYTDTKALEAFNKGELIFD